ncbi:hypothetical protein, partial [Enterobacter hormaechei]
YARECERTAGGINFFGISGSYRTTKTPPDQFQSGARSIIIGILHMSRVLLGPEKESNHYAL